MSSIPFDLLRGSQKSMQQGKTIHPNFQMVHLTPNLPARGCRISRPASRPIHFNSRTAFRQPRGVRNKVRDDAPGNRVVRQSQRAGNDFAFSNIADSLDLRLLKVCGSPHVPKRKAADLGRREVCPTCFYPGPAGAKILRFYFSRSFRTGGVHNRIQRN